MTERPRRRGLAALGVGVAVAVLAPSAEACSVLAARTEMFQLEFEELVSAGAQIAPPPWMPRQPLLSADSHGVSLHARTQHPDGWDECFGRLHRWTFDVEFDLRRAAKPDASVACFFDEVAQNERQLRKGWSRIELTRPGTYYLARQRGKERLPLPAETELSVGVARNVVELLFSMDKRPVLARYRVVASSFDPMIAALCPDPQMGPPTVRGGGCGACAIAMDDSRPGWGLSILLALVALLARRHSVRDDKRGAKS